MTFAVKVMVQSRKKTFLLLSISFVLMYYVTGYYRQVLSHIYEPFV